MKMIQFPAQGAATAKITTSNRVLRNTYNLLSMTLLFSGAVAYAAMVFRLPHPGILLTLVGFYGLLFAIHKTRNSGWSLLLCFALTGFMGYTIGPILTYYLAIPNGGELIGLAFASTAALFLGLSFYGTTTQRDLSFMGGFVFAGIIVVLVTMLANLFLQIPLLALAINALLVPLMSAVIVYQTNMIVKGHQTNYVLATVSLFVAIYNLFLSILNLLALFRE